MYVSGGHMDVYHVDGCVSSLSCVSHSQHGISCTRVVLLFICLILPHLFLQASLRVLHEEDLAVALHNFVEKDDKVFLTPFHS